MTVHTFSLLYLCKLLATLALWLIWMDGNIYKVGLNEVSVKKMYSIYFIRAKKNS